MQTIFKEEYREVIEAKREIWVSLEALGFPLYDISSTAKIRRVTGHKVNILRMQLDQGYKAVRLQFYNDRGHKKSKCKKLHYLLGSIFLVKPEGENLTVDHIDRKILNNDLYNLRWATKRLQSLNRAPYTTRSAKVNQYDKNGLFIRQWDSTKAAVASSPHFNINTIQATLKGVSKTAHGYVWQYDKDEIEGEEWKIHPDLNIPVSDKGRIKRKNGMPTIGNLRDRRDVVTIEYKKYLISRLVAETFHGVRDGHQVIHIDGNLRNNHKENLMYAGYASSYIRPNSEANQPIDRSIPVIQIDRKTKEIVAYFASAKAAAIAVNLPYCSIKLICNRKSISSGQGRYSGGFKWRYASHPSYQEKLRVFKEKKDNKRNRDDEDDTQEEKAIKRVKQS